MPRALQGKAFDPRNGKDEGKYLNKARNDPDQKYANDEAVQIDIRPNDFFNLQMSKPAASANQAHDNEHSKDLACRLCKLRFCFPVCVIHTTPLAARFSA